MKLNLERMKDQLNIHNGIAQELIYNGFALENPEITELKHHLSEARRITFNVMSKYGSKIEVNRD